MDWLHKFYLFFQKPPDSLFQLAQKEFFTGALKNTSLKISKISQENFCNGLQYYYKLAG